MTNQSPIYLILAGLLVLNACKKEDPVTPANPTLTTLPCDYFNTNRVLTDDTTKAVDYIINCVMEVRANIRIEPGVVIHFTENAGIVVKSGHLNAVGTEDKPIVMQGAMNIPGFWRGVYFQNSSLLNELTYTHLIGAGGQAFDSNGDRGAVIFFGPGKAKIHNSRIERSAHFGLNAPYSNCEFDLQNTLFTNCAKAPINIEPEYIGLIDPNNSFTSNVENFVAVQLNGGVIEGNKFVKALSIPYRIYQVSGFYEWLIIQNGVLTTDGPVVFEFNDGLGISIETSGGINAEGTADAKVLFTGVSNQAGAWRGLYFNYTLQDNRISNAIIEYAGSPYFDERFAIAMWNSPRLRVENSTFRNINGCGFLDYNGIDNPNQNLIQTNNSFINITGSDICYP